MKCTLENYNNQKNMHHRSEFVTKIISYNVNVDKNRLVRSIFGFILL